MLIADIRRFIKTIDHEGFFHHFLHQRPIQKVEVMGIITKIVNPRKRCIYYIDDGTGVIRCSQYFQEQPMMVTAATTATGASGGNVNVIGGDSGYSEEAVNASLASLQVGSLVKVKGTLEQTETDREEYGLALRVKMLDDCSHDRNMELVFKLEAIHLMQTMYSQPFP